MADEVWVDFLPGLKKFGPTLVKGTTKAAAEAGSKSGKDYSKAFEAGSTGASDAAISELEGAQKRAAGLVSKMSGEVSRARQTQQKSAADLITAELRVADAVEKYGAESGQAAAASLKLEAARGKAEDAARKFSNAEDGLREAQKSQKTVTEQLTTAQSDLGDEVKQQPGKWDRFGSALGSAKDKAKDFAGGIGGVITTMAGAVGGAALMSAAFSDALELDSATGKLEATLAATPEQAQRYGEAAANLYAGAWGESIDDTAEAVDAVVSSITGMSDASQTELEKVTSHAMDLASAFGVDVTEAANTAGIMINNGLAKDGVDAMDQLTWAMQNVPKSVRGELLPVMDEYSTSFAQLGIDGETAMALIVGGSDNGAIAMDKVGDSLKEFTIRATDLSNGTRDAYNTLGLDTEEMTSSLLAGGDSAESAMGQIISGLQGIKDPGEQAATSIALFGTPLEDLGTNKIPGFLDAINPANAEMKDLTGTAEDMGNALNDNTATSIETTKRSFMNMLSEGIQPLLGPLQGFADWAANTPGVLTAVAIGLGAMAVGWAAVTLAASPWLALAVGIGLAIGGVVFAVMNMRESVSKLGDLWGTVWGGIKTAAGAVVDWFSTHVVGTFKQVYGALFGGDSGDGPMPEDSPVIGFLHTLRDTASSVADWFMTNIVGTFKQIYGSLVNGDFEGGGALNEDAPIIVFIFKLRNAASSVADWFTGTFLPAIKSVWDNITKAFSVAGSVIRGIWTGFLQPVIQLFGDTMRWLWSEQIQPRLLWIQAAWRVMGDMVVGFWTNRIKPMIQAFGALVTGLYSRYISPALGWISDRWSWISSKVTGFWRDRIRPILSAFGTFVKVTLVGSVRAGLGWISDRWSWVTTKVSDIWTGKLRPIFRAVGTFVKEDVPGMVESGVAKIDKAWRKVANFFRKPINWVINTVWNKGIKGAFDSVAEAVKSTARLDSMPTIPAFKDGGRHGGGWALVGEEGPELVDFRTPGRVYTASETAQALTGDVSPEASTALAGSRPSEAQLPMGGWGSKIWDTLAGAASGVVSWVRGGLANAAESLFKPIVSSATSKMAEFGSMGELGGGMIDWGVDKVLDWVRGEDKPAASGGGFEYDGPMNMGHIYRPSRGGITSGYGMRWGRLHGGVDFATGPRGAPTFAAYDGVVHSIGNYPGGSGRAINLSHGNGMYTHYGHNDAIYVAAGEAVRAGQRIGTEGMSGNTTGPHLHFEKWQGGLWNRTNPNGLFQYDNGGYMEPGVQLNVNKTRKPEPVLTDPQWKIAEAAIKHATENTTSTASLVGAKIEIGPDGLARFVDGRIEIHNDKTARAALRGARKAGAR